MLNVKPKDFAYFCIGMLILVIGATLSAKLDLGIATYDSFVLNTSIGINLTYGTCNVILGIILVIAQFFIIKKVDLLRFKQMIMLAICSYTYNFFLYYVFKDLVVTNIVLKLMLFVLADILMSIGIAFMTSFQFESFPLETIMKEIHDHYGYDMGMIKYGIDALWLVLSVLVFFIFNQTNLHIGLGTLFLFVTQGKLISIFYNILQKKELGK